MIFIDLRLNDKSVSRLSDNQYWSKFTTSNTSMMNRVLYILLSIFYYVNGEIRLSLNSDRVQWTVTNQNNSIKTNAKVPGGIYTDLQTDGFLSTNLFYRFNDIEYRWVAKDNWTYQTTFNVPSEILNKKVINLVFHGLDTLADISFNEKATANADNMFVRYVIPIKNDIAIKNNILSILFKSPIYESSWLAAQQKANYTIPPECTPDQYNGECNVNFLRKMQASFSWDWGPAFPSVGIWKQVDLEAYDSAIIRDIAVSSEKVTETGWRVNATIFIESASDDSLGNHIILANLKTPTGEDINGTVLDEIKDPDKTNSFISRVIFYLNEKNVHLWWPNGFGDQPLYTLNATFKSFSSNETSTKEIKIGIRTIELVQEKLQSNLEGLSFYFKVNGVPIFAKGTNWIPGDILPEKGYDESLVKNALHSAKEANMNILRVWGGGVYESNLFYQLADELGLMVWQDMMFACAMYPANDKFLKNVETEIEQQIRRLQHHPSIILWAGNNENEAALRQNWYGTKRNFELYKKDYVKLYIDTIQKVIEENDKSRSYLSSSPTNGIKTIEEGYVAENPYSALFGDTHYYNYLFDSWDSNKYPNTRFASEYGFQSMPSYRALMTVATPDDLKIDSEFTKKRQHLLAGNQLLQVLISQHLHLPTNVEPAELYKTFVYFSQITQAMGTKTETEKYRRDRSKLTNMNEGNTMGAMYWQLNDVWQAPSWSSIEYGGRWKMLHYFVKNFFSPVLVSPELTSYDELNVHLVSDLLYDVPGAELNISVYSWDDFNPRKIISSKEILRNATSQIHATLQLSNLLQESQCEKTTCFIYFTLSTTNISSENVIYPAKLKDVKNLYPANVTVNLEPQKSSDQILLQVNTNRIAPFVWFETDEPGQFSDNGFLLLKNSRQISFTNRGAEINLDNFKNTLIVRSLI